MTTHSVPNTCWYVKMFKYGVQRTSEIVYKNFQVGLQEGIIRTFLKKKQVTNLHGFKFQFTAL
jgi:hypothetical protein